MTMVPVNSVQREPSMEEILASIRRIIEDSDTTRKAPDLPAPTEAGEVDAFRVELGSAEPVRDEGRDGGFSFGQSPAAAQPPGAEEAPEDVGEARTAATPTPVDMDMADDALPEEDEQTSDAADLELDMGDLNAGEINGAHFSFPAQADASHPEMSAAHAEAPRAQSEASRPAIISEQTGRQVAASFGELSEAFTARSRRSFDEIAEEMLRPMLQDWLDNNLPHLVERLVREEIERIARGSVAPR
ncbi:MAG TPA: PopZ family protein [Mesorhizobium sp.]|jgi:hypothetical protein|nr:PopZ family protein [Mesorhizobium sp.]